MKRVFTNALLSMCLLIAGLTPEPTWAAESFELLSAGSVKDKRVLRYDLKVGTQQTVQTITKCGLKILRCQSRWFKSMQPSSRRP